MGDAQRPAPTGATVVDRRPITADDVACVIELYDVGRACDQPKPAGGTANTNCHVTTDRGRFVLRRRNAKYAVPAYVAFDHRLMEHLAQRLPAGRRRYDEERLPAGRRDGVAWDGCDQWDVCGTEGSPAARGSARRVTPLAVLARSGKRWVVVNGDTYELYPYRPGRPHDRHSLAEIQVVGAGLAEFHLAAASFEAPSGKQWPRYDDPAQVRSGIEEMRDDLAAMLSPDDLAYLEEQVALIVRDLNDRVYAALPRHVIHGDFHPANLTFEFDPPLAIAGIYDLDWCTVQPRVRDVADGLIFFAGVRDGDVDSADIRLLTRTWRPDLERSSAFLAAYTETCPLTDDEVRLLPVFMRARWLHCRTIGRSKVREDQRTAFFVNGLLEPLRALDAL